LVNGHLYGLKIARAISRHYHTDRAFSGLQAGGNKGKQNEQSH
jgi:hypothetical protein